MALVCDTSVVLAAFDRDDSVHDVCAELLRTADEDLVLPTLVLAEIDYWCRKRKLVRSWPAMLDETDAGVWRVVHPTAADLRRAKDLLIQYADLDLGIIDASLIALCERLEELKVATLDRRHFTAVRPLHVPALSILPE